MARLFLLGILAFVFSTGATVCADDPPPANAGGELIFDPNKHDWVEIAPPQPGTDAGDLEIARRLLAERKYKDARRALRTWRKEYPESALWQQALFFAADVEVYAANDGQSNDLWRGYEAYEELLNAGAPTELADRAVRREMVVAEMFLFKKQKRRIWKGMLRVSAEDEALTILDRIIDDRAPNTPIAEQCIRMQADYHYSRGEFELAERAYARLARDFPRGKYVRQALERSADSALAGFAGVEFDDAPLLEAEERFSDYRARYPDAAQQQSVPQTLERIRDSRAEKEYSIGAFYERTKHRDAAQYYYRFVANAWPETVWADKARQRLGMLAPPEVPPDAAVPTSEPASQPTTEPDAQPGAPSASSGQ